MSCSQLTSIEQRHKSLSPRCILLQHLKFPIIGYKPCLHDTGQLAMFASKYKQVVQIRTQVSHVEAVLERWSLPQNVGNANVNVYHLVYLTSDITSGKKGKFVADSNGCHFETFEILNTVSIWPHIWKDRPKLCQTFFSWRRHRWRHIVHEPGGLLVPFLVASSPIHFLKAQNFYFMKKFGGHVNKVAYCPKLYHHGSHHHRI